VSAIKYQNSKFLESLAQPITISMKKDQISARGNNRKSKKHTTMLHSIMETKQKYDEIEKEIEEKAFWDLEVQSRPNIKEKYRVYNFINFGTIY